MALNGKIKQWQIQPQPRRKIERQSKVEDKIIHKYSPIKLWDGAQVAIFGDFFGSCICSEPRATPLRPAF